MAERSAFTWIFVVGVPLVVIGGGIAYGVWTPKEPSGPPADTAPAPKPAVDAAVVPEGPLEITDTKIGTGPEAKVGDKVSVHYVGTLVDGTEFDSSRKHERPFDFELGAGRVIKGWDQGVVGMKVGGQRRLRIPPSLGYGARGMPPVIPPSSTLVFDVELLEIKPK